MLDALKGNLQARAAIALTYFGGFRPGEVRGLRWEDYELVPVFNGEHEEPTYEWQLTPRRSIWHTETTPKTEERSVRPVVVIEPLRTILAELRKADGNPQTGPILCGPSGKPLNLDNLSRRIIGPTLKAAGIAWRGFYTQRHGLAQRLRYKTGDVLAESAVLRHTPEVAQAHYIGAVEEAARKGMHMIEQEAMAAIAKKT